VRAWLVIAAMGCHAGTPAAVVSNHAPSWKQHCAPLLEQSVRADADGVDHLVARVDDDLRTCWRLAVRIVDAGHPVAPPPSCRALRVSEMRLSADWLASCRRFEAGAPPPRPALASRRVSTIGVVRYMPSAAAAAADSDHDGVPDLRDRCPDEPADGNSVDGCPGRLRINALREGVPLQAPAMPPYDLTPAAQGICGAVQDIVAHFAAAPNPTIPLALAQQWSADARRYDVEWPVESTIAPVEDALRACLADWSLEIVKTREARRLRWQKAHLLVELRTAPERLLSIAAH